MAEFEPLRTITVHDFTSPDREIVAHPDGARELVRCKDCKYRYDEGKCPMVFGYYVDYDDDGYWESEWRTEDNTEDEGFCHRGEREEE